jgi:hypothetical protein
MRRRTFLSAAAGLTTAAVLLAEAARHARSHVGGLYVQMGTSITAGIRAPDAYRSPAIVGECLGMEAVNVGFEGASACTGHSPEFDQLSLVRLVDAITTRDWSAQDEAMVKFADETKVPILERLKAVDYSRVSYLGLEYGTNDFTLNMPIGSDTDESPATFKGALNQSVLKLRAAFPRLKPFFITPAWFLDYEDRDTDHYPNKAGFFLIDYVDAMLSIAERRQIHGLDMWRRLGINSHNYGLFTFDSKHPNAAGAELRGDLTAWFIKHFVSRP